MLIIAHLLLFVHIFLQKSHLAKAAEANRKSFDVTNAGKKDVRFSPLPADSCLLARPAAASCVRSDLSGKYNNKEKILHTTPPPGRRPHSRYMETFNALSSPPLRRFTVIYWLSVTPKAIWREKHPHFLKSDYCATIIHSDPVYIYPLMRL